MLGGGGGRKEGHRQSNLLTVSVLSVLPFPLPGNTQTPPFILQNSAQMGRNSPLMPASLGCLCSCEYPVTSLPLPLSLSPSQHLSNLIPVHMPSLSRAGDLLIFESQHMARCGAPRRAFAGYSLRASLQGLLWTVLAHLLICFVPLGKVSSFSFTLLDSGR